MIKGLIQQKPITLINIYAPNIGVPKHKANTDTEEESDSNTVTGGDFDTPFTSVDRSSRQRGKRQ